MQDMKDTLHDIYGKSYSPTIIGTLFIDTCPLPKVRFSSSNDELRNHLTLYMPGIENYTFMPGGGEFDPPLRSQLVVV